jgi:rubredoxin
MNKWRCSICGYIYDPKIGDIESGLEPGLFFEGLPEYWGCPDCGAAKDYFEKIDNSHLNNLSSDG